MLFKVFQPLTKFIIITSLFDIDLCVSSKLNFRCTYNMRNCLSADGHLVVSSKRQNEFNLRRVTLKLFFNNWRSIKKESGFVGLQILGSVAIFSFIPDLEWSVASGIPRKIRIGLLCLSRDLLTYQLLLPQKVFTSLCDFLSCLFTLPWQRY